MQPLSFSVRAGLDYETLVHTHNVNTECPCVNTTVCACDIYCDITPNVPFERRVDSLCQSFCVSFQVFEPGLVPQRRRRVFFKIRNFHRVFYLEQGTKNVIFFADGLPESCADCKIDTYINYFSDTKNRGYSR